MLQTSWTAFFGTVAVLEGLVIGWWAEKIYKIWSRLFARVASIQWPWLTRNEVEAEGEVKAVIEVIANEKGQHRQAAIDARDVCYKFIDACAKVQ